MLTRALFAVFCSVLAIHSQDLPPDHAERMTKGLDLFGKKVKAILVENCVQCHGGEKVKGELNTVTRDGLLHGGADGVMVVPFKAKESRLLRLVRHEEEPHMPDKKPKLPEEAIKALEEWIENGAPYEGALLDGAKLATAEKGVVSEEDKKWWAFQPLKSVTLPTQSGPLRTAAPALAENPIDRFIAAKSAGKGLKISSAAERRVLIRRLYLDLLGLPPRPDEVDEFLKDERADAWERLVNRTLSSPHYGERWARHWLDVARFAESSGFEHDYDREGAYQYRDFVIRALNADMPFDQFLRWQIAGDEFEPENAMALTATGFLGAGVFPTQITANEVERTRYDAMDDMLSTTSAAFLGVTVGCARCHDHKFDPIPTADYYRMLSTFTTTTRSVVDLDVEPEKTALKKAEWARQHAPLQLALSGYEAELRPRFEEWMKGGMKVDGPVWTVLDLTESKSKAGATFKKLEDGSWLVEGKNGDKDDYTFKAALGMSNVTGLKLEALSDPSMKHGGPGRADNGNIGLSRIRILVGTNEVKIAKAIATFEQNTNSLSIAAALDEDAQTGWAVDPQFGKNHAAVFTFAEPIRAGSELTVKLEFGLNTRHNIGRPRLSVISGGEPKLDGEVVSPNVAQLLAADVTEISEKEQKELFDWWKRRDAGWKDRAAKVEAHAKLKPTGLTKALICAEGYTPLRMHTQGADFFNETYLLRRGNTDLKNGVASQDFLQVMMRTPERGARWKFEAPKGAKFSGRRRSLANWMTDLDAGAGPQVARVIANRLWQHHFGQGIVSTPNDFGHAGAAPTHPELLEWLAGELTRSGWKLKSMHKLMLTSATYQQNTMADAAKEAADPENKLFVRRLPRRLEGEALRDSVLAVTGALDRTMYGPGTKNEASVRRSIYFTVKRSELVGSMVVFDLPEPLVSQAVRPTTTVAPQALFLMNAPQVREWAKMFAKQLETEATTDGKVRKAFLLALGREPSSVEREQSAKFLESNEVADFCQVILGLNEFAYEN
ncbi:MAG TPA: PSD1 and planctomycete cytochrome C domain-containing protein [Verrucomicrobiae bacterium]|nr:PSD1 and planctomycete cytochrome C domain-containing protein [Verrucomicrobiae bacterium]